MKQKLEYFSLQPILKFFKFSKFTCILSACQPTSLPACLPAVRPGCARCRAPEISHDKGNGGRFTKMLFRRRFTYCATTIPFILLSLSLFFFIPLEMVAKNSKQLQNTPSSLVNGSVHTVNSKQRQQK